MEDDNGLFIKVKCYIVSSIIPFLDFAPKGAKFAKILIFTPALKGAKFVKILIFTPEYSQVAAGALLMTFFYML